jgi:hypothetical protein
VTWVASSSLRLRLESLREIGGVPVETTLLAGPRDGWSLTTEPRRVRASGVFLKDRERRHGALELDELSAGDVKECS